MQRYQDDKAWIAYATETEQLLMYQDTKSSMKMELEMFHKHEPVRFRSDVVDTHIDICAPEVCNCLLWAVINWGKVLEIFQDNFDFQDFRQDFIIDFVLSESDVNEYKAYVELVSGCYAARIDSLRSYENIRFVKLPLLVTNF